MTQDYFLEFLEYFHRAIQQVWETWCVGGKQLLFPSPSVYPHFGGIGFVLGRIRICFSARGGMEAQEMCIYFSQVCVYDFFQGRGGFPTSQNVIVTQTGFLRLQRRGPRREGDLKMEHLRIKGIISFSGLQNTASALCGTTVQGSTFHLS